MSNITDIKENPFFSIIIPTYNRAHTLRRPIESLLSQTFTNWELIIVDDGSTDETRSIVASYNDQRIKYVWQENQERSAARNHGIRLAQGEWLCFQDSDDEYMIEHLEVLYNSILNNSSCPVHRTGVIIQLENGNKIKPFLHKVDKYDPYPMDSFHAQTFHHSVLKNIEFNSQYNTVEDFEFLFRVGHKFPIYQIENIWSVKYYYDPFSSGVIGKKYEHNLHLALTCYTDMLKWVDKEHLPIIKRRMCKSILFLFVGHLKNNRNKMPQAIVENIKVFFRYPFEYIRLIGRILYVKWGEWTGWYKVKYRF